MNGCLRGGREVIGGGMVGMAFFFLTLDMQIQFRFCRKGCDVSGFVEYLKEKAKGEWGE